MNSGHYVVACRANGKNLEYSNGYCPGNEIIYDIKTRSCRLCHGSYSWAATGLKSLFSFGLADPLEHWWMTINTSEGYYVLQF